jgi:hypothetical protein
LFGFLNVHINPERSVWRGLSMNIKALAAAVCLAVVTATSGMAATLDFSFTVTQASQSVDGVVRGLTDNSASGASEVVLFSPSGNADVVLTPSTFLNYFLVSNGLIVDFNAVATGDASFDIKSFAGPAPAVAVSWVAEGLFLNNSSIVFQPGVVVEMPAGGLLLLTGFAVLRLRKKRVG